MLEQSSGFCESSILFKEFFQLVALVKAKFFGARFLLSVLGSMMDSVCRVTLPIDRRSERSCERSVRDVSSKGGSLVVVVGVMGVVRLLLSGRMRLFLC